MSAQNLDGESRAPEEGVADAFLSGGEAASPADGAANAQAQGRAEDAPDFSFADVDSADFATIAELTQAPPAA